MQKCLAFAAVQWAHPDLARPDYPHCGTCGPRGFLATAGSAQALLGVARLGSTLAFASQKSTCLITTAHARAQWLAKEEARG